MYRRRYRGVIGFGGTVNKSGSRFFFGVSSSNPGDRGIGIGVIGNIGIANGGIIILICIRSGFGGGGSSILRIVSSGCLRSCRIRGGITFGQLEIIKESRLLYQIWSRIVKTIVWRRHFLLFFWCIFNICLGGIPFCLM